MPDTNALTLAGVPLNELERLRADLLDVNRGLIRRQKMIAPSMQMVNEAISMAKTPPDRLFISDHALVRWMERVEGFDFGPIREKIQSMTAGRYNPADDHEVVISGDVVIIIRGRRRDLGKDGPSMVTTVLTAQNATVPEKGQLSVLKKSPSVSTIGKIGGIARASKLSPQRRSEIAREAAKARWAKR
jgi:hypothetical protein